MVRPPLTAAERERGRRLGAVLRVARGDRSPAEVAAASGVSQEALRKIETGRVPTPAFSTVAAPAGALDVPLDRLLADLAPPAEDTALTAWSERERDRTATGCPGTRSEEDQHREHDREHP